MRIAAIYIEEHEYLFDQPQTINFSTRLNYSFRREGDSIIVAISPNPCFIPGFFKLTDTISEVSNVTAIVGQNGAGKSTLLDIIRSTFIRNRYALPHCKTLILFEKEAVEHPVVVQNDFDSVFLEVSDKKEERIQLSDDEERSIQTLYYSPHFDYKLNPNFDDVDNHDISFDKLVEQDLAELRYKSTDENGWVYSPSQELIFKNSLRQIRFLSSDLVAKKEIFKALFDLPDHYEPILYFRGYKEEYKERNTPYELRKIMQVLNSQIEKELDQWATVRVIKDEKVVNQYAVHQYILKRHVMKYILSLIRHQMERNNFFLQSGYFPYEEFHNELYALDAYRLFLLFIDKSAIGSSTNRKLIFLESKLPELLAKIFEAIDKATDEDLVSNDTLRTSKDDAIAILELQRLFLNNLNTYYYRFYTGQELPKDSDRIEEFVNYMPFSRRMSSGESSLLNFFSRIYDFLGTNLIDLKYRVLCDHYVLLLDEADLTFHLTWKKRYVKALLKTIPHFFEQLENKPSIEIIFTTHDPLTLSDLPNRNVIYIKRNSANVQSRVLDYQSEERPRRTFGANISELIADSFFVENSLIGDFAFDKIQDAIAWLNQRQNFNNVDYYKKLIKTIDEPIVQRKLAEMYDEKMATNVQIEVIDDQINKLEVLKKKLEK